MQNQLENNFPCDKKWRIRQIAINNGWNTQIVQVLLEKRDLKFIFKVNLLNILPKPVELSHKWVLENFWYQEI